MVAVSATAALPSERSRMQETGAGDERRVVTFPLEGNQDPRPPPRQGTQREHCEGPGAAGPFAR